MVGLEIDGYPVRIKHRIEGMHHLLPQPFLDRKTLSKQPHEAGELGNADDGGMREIACVGVSDIASSPCRPIWPADDFSNESLDESRFGQGLSQAPSPSLTNIARFVPSRFNPGGILLNVVFFVYGPNKS
jgi:hypothetical protein